LSGVGQSAFFTEAGSVPVLQLELRYDFHAVSQTKKYRQETLMSKVESEPSVTNKLLVT
jgi:hypothetical protein